MNIKDKQIVVVTVLIVILLFILQLFFVLRLYQFNKNTIQSELNIALDLAYLDGLSHRLNLKDESKNGDLADSLDKRHRVFLDYHDSLLIGLIRDIDIRNFISMPIFKRTDIENLELEISLSDSYPFSFEMLDYFITSLFLKSDKNLMYDIVYFNPETNEIYKNANSLFEDGFVTLESRTIYLDKDGTQAIKLKAVPTESLLFYITCLIFVILLLSLFCIYCFCFQLKIIDKQKELGRTKNDFYSEVSHELIRSLSLLTQAVDSLKIEDNILNSEKRSRYITYADQEIAKMAKKTEMVLSLAREEEGVLELNIKRFDLVKLIYDEVDAVLAVPPKSVDIDIDVTSSFLTDKCIYGDKDHLEQVISNLISNALKYSGNHLDLKIKLWRDQQDVFISIKDNGFGIDVQYHDVVFQKYMRVGANAGLKGHGIGLNYVKRIVEKHDGEISLISNLGVGSEFIIRLPQ